MQFSIIALLAAATAVVANVPDSCDKQLKQCTDAPNADAAVCDSRQTICLTSCENGFKSCDASGTTDKAKCASVFEQCAGHPRE